MAVHGSGGSAFFSDKSQTLWERSLRHSVIQSHSETLNRRPFRRLRSRRSACYYASLKQIRPKSQRPCYRSRELDAKKPPFPFQVPPCPSAPMPNTPSQISTIGFKGVFRWLWLTVSSRTKYIVCDSNKSH